MTCDQAADCISRDVAAYRTHGRADHAAYLAVTAAVAGGAYREAAFKVLTGVDAASCVAALSPTGDATFVAVTGVANAR